MKASEKTFEMKFQLKTKIYRSKHQWFNNGLLHQPPRYHLIFLLALRALNQIMSFHNGFSFWNIKTYDEAWIKLRHGFIKSRLVHWNLFLSLSLWNNCCFIPFHAHSLCTSKKSIFHSVYCLLSEVEILKKFWGKDF